MNSPTDQISTLPALKPAGALADLRPCIVIDTREQTPLPFRNLSTVTDTLLTGDYSFRGGEELFAIERKSVPDLVSCCMGDNRVRFERELHRLRGYRFKRLLVVGHSVEIEQHRYRSDLAPKAVLNTLAAFEVRYDVPVVWSALPNDAALLVERLAWWFARELVLTSNRLCGKISERGPAEAGELTRETDTKTVDSAGVFGQINGNAALKNCAT